MTVNKRTPEQWEQLVDAGHEYLVNLARNGGITDYTGFNQETCGSAGQPYLDFQQPDGPTTVSRLLYEIANRDTGPYLITALVKLKNGEGPGGGFFTLAQDRDRLAADAPKLVKEKFWLDEINLVHGHYRRQRTTAH